jgi:hypothetical protein
VGCVQATKRASRKLGLGLAPLGAVSSDMAAEGKALVELTNAFGVAVEALVIKHNKAIVEQQLQLARWVHPALLAACAPESCCPT